MNTWIRLSFAPLSLAMLAGCSGSGQDEFTDVATPIQDAPRAEPASTASALSRNSATAPAASTNQANQARLAAQGEVATKAPPAMPGTGSATARNHLRMAAVATNHPHIDSPVSHATAVAVASGTSLSKALLANKPMHTYSLKIGDIGISNFDEQVQVHFAIRTIDGAWQDQSLAPAATDEFLCGFGQDCRFWMQTGTKPAVYYTMQSPTRYAIFWNAEKELWDLEIAREGD